MTFTPRRLPLVLWVPLFFLAAVLQAADFGVLVKGEFETLGQGETAIGGSCIVAPWLSVPFNNKAELYFSAGLNAGKDLESVSAASVAAPELFRLEYFSRPTAAFSFRAGRIIWQDVSGFTAKGRFDGVELLYDAGTIRVGASALYTGLLFKDTAYINVSPTDPRDYGKSFDWADFSGSYFAPRRLLASVYAELPGLPPGRGHLYAGLMAQFDLSGAKEAFHSQYLLLRHTLVYKAFDLALAGAAELEHTKAGGVKPAFAYALQGGWQTPTKMNDRLSAGITWASGDSSGVAAFFPVTREAQSFVLRPSISGMMIARVNYAARFLPSLWGDAEVRYLIRTDGTTFAASHLKKDKYLLGAELDAGAFWAPFSDLSFSLRGGVFLPQTGSAWTSEAPVVWRLTVGSIVSF